MAVLMTDAGTGNGGDVRGYNPIEFTELGEKIVDISRKAVEDIGEELQRGLFVPISTTWYTQEGKEYFDGLVDTIKSYAHAIWQVYTDFRMSVNEAGNIWADNTKNPRPLMPFIPELEITGLDSSIILPSDNNRAIIDGPAAMAVANNLVNIKADLIAKIEAENSQLDASSQFIGAGQAQAVQDLFVRMVKIIDELFLKLMGDGSEGEEGDSIFANINRAVKKQEAVAEGIASSFNKAQQG